MNLCEKKCVRVWFICIWIWNYKSNIWACVSLLIWRHVYQVSCKIQYFCRLATIIPCNTLKLFVRAHLLRKCLHWLPSVYRISSYCGHGWSVSELLSLWFLQVIGVLEMQASVSRSGGSAGDMTATECYNLIKAGVNTEVPGLDLYYDKVVNELRGLFICIICVFDLLFKT